VQPTRQLEDARVFRRLGRPITRVLTDDPVAAFTFDDGPEPDYTPKTLGVLKDFGAKATFFMVGEAARQHPNIVKEVAEAGHAVCNHSWSHQRFPLISSLKCIGELRKCRRALEPYGRNLFRPPYGMNNGRSNLLVSLCGYKAIGWCLDVKDWCEPSAAVMMEGLVRGISPGCIILLHDGLYVRSEEEKARLLASGRVLQRESMLAALEGTLKRLRNKFEFVTIPALLERGAVR